MASQCYEITRSGTAETRAAKTANGASGASSNRAPVKSPPHATRRGHARSSQSHVVNAYQKGVIYAISVATSIAAARYYRALTVAMRKMPTLPTPKISLHANQF